MSPKAIVTPDGEKEFQLRVLKDEGVGLLTTKSEKSYLILDSLDYWYDLIQTSYPKKKKCNCANEWFHVKFAFLLRDDEKDIKNVQITAICTRCAKLSKVMSVDLDYSPTLHFLEQPIHYCEKPNIKYKYNELNSYWRHDDLKRFLEFTITGLGLHAYCYFAQYPENTRHFEEVNLERAIEITTVNHRYFDFYFSCDKIDSSRMVQENIESGVIVKKDLWREHEMIHLSSPFSIMGYGLLFYIHFCTQHIVRGNVVDKSPEFEETTNQLVHWLRTTFITGRGKNCFDGDEAHKQVMAKLKSKT